VLTAYTVLLLVPDTLAGTFGQETYLAHTESGFPLHAIADARDAAMDAYKAWDDGIEPSAFHVLFVAHGHQHNLAE
jgi:hypothetical protein